jgi:alanine dehydrogenase
MGLLLLNFKEIQNFLRMEDVLRVVEEAFREYGLGRAQMPPKQYLFYKKYDGDLRVMPSYLEALNISAVKVVNVHPKNRENNLPTVMGTIVLIDPSTGAPLAIMDGTWITAMRTGAAGGVAVKYLARKDAKKLGIIGAGVQARTQLMAISNVLKLEEVKVFDLIKEAREGLAKEIAGKYPGLRCVAVESAEEAVKDSDVIVTVTPSRQPVVKLEWVKPGAHINAFGADAPGKEELDPEILVRAKVVIDDWEQASHSGEINVPLSQGKFSKEKVYGMIGDVVAGKMPGRTSDEEITIFCSTGLALQDAVTAKLAYDKAVKEGIGKNFEILG